MTERTYRGPWCGICGSPGRVTTESIDPNRPLGICRRGAPDKPGCGKVPLTRLQAEADAVYDARKSKFATMGHSRHHVEKWPTPLCRTCASLWATGVYVPPGTLALGSLPGAVQPEGGR